MTLDNKPTNWYELVGYLSVKSQVELLDFRSDGTHTSKRLVFERACDGGFVFKTEAGNYQIVPARHDKNLLSFYDRYCVVRYNDTDPLTGARLVLNYRD